MSLALLLEELAARRIELRMEEGKLRYRAPQGALTPAWRERIVEHREALMAHLSGRPPAEPEILRRPASEAQRALWFVDRVNGPTPAFNIPLTLRLRGPLDTAALHAALDALVERQQALRSGFEYRDEEVLLCVRRSLGARWEEIDLTAAGEETLDACVREVALHCFDLEFPPLLLARLIRVAAREHVLALNVHHIVADGWSTGIILEEIAAGYEAFRAGRSADLPPLTWQYQDYLAWRERLLQSGRMEEDLRFWRDLLEGAPEPVTMPLDQPRPAVHDLHGSLVSFSLDRNATARLRSQARRWGASVSHVTLAATAQLLAKHSGSRDLVFGVPLANRSRRELEPLVGLFVNVVPLRLILGSAPSLEETVAQVRRLSTQALEHCQLPGERLLDDSRIPRDGVANPLYRVVHNFLPRMEKARRIGDLEVEVFDAWGGVTSSKADCTFYFEEDHGGLTGHIEYCTSLYRRTSVERWARELAGLLGAVEPPEERRQLPAEWNATAAPLPDKRFHQFFEGYAERDPGAPAVVCGGESLTYGELNLRANRLAHALIGLGAGPEVLVAVALEPSPETVVAILATLKAGAAYLPLDPAYPDGRLNLMLEDADARILVTQESLRGRLRTAARTLAIDTDSQTIAAQPASNPDVCVSPGQLAYVIYTSGSTGSPKGVAVEHRGLGNLAGVLAGMFGLTPHSRVLQFASFAFDASVWELVMGLASGAALYLPDSEERLGGERLGEFLRHAAITHATLPPALLATLPRQPLPALEVLIVAGESCPPALAAFWSQGRRFFNAYGPTETTFCATLAECAGLDGTAALPIGRPIANTRLYVLDPNLQPVPIGMAGELCISAAGLARGYWNQPELTAAKFIPNPFAEQDRLYRTGDLVRYRPDGNLEFLGRIDHEVKIRGFRIEPGEIETALAAAPGVVEAVVVSGSAGGELRLIAYVVAGAGPLDAGALRAFLKTSLPEYMVPADWVFLPALPLTPNGKVNRSALPEPRIPLPVPSSVAPRDELERTLARIWAGLLQRPDPGIDEDFFMWGGHSLLAVRLASRLRDALGVAVPVRWVFEAPTIARLAERLRHEKSQTEAPPGTIAKAPRGSVLPASFAQRRLWFLDRLEGPNPAYNIAGELEITGALDCEALGQALAEIVRRHESLRTRLAENDGEPVQRIEPAGPVALPVIDLRRHADPCAEADRLAGLEARQPFDLERDAPLRAQLLRRGECAWTLLLTLHHAAADGWSAAILLRELEALYDAFRQGRPSPLPELGIQYADYAVWQREHLNSERLLDYWSTQLAGAPDCLNLPLDRPRTPRQSYSGNSLEFTIDASLTAALQELSRRSDATLFMTLLAAWSVLLGRYSGSEDVVIGSPVANRTVSEVEPLIGFFANTLALRVKLAGNPSFSELLAQVRHTCVEAYAHQELPFESVVEALAVRRNLAHAPVFQAMFALQNAEQGSVALPGLEIVARNRPATAAKFDLNLSITQTGGELTGTLVYGTDLFDRATMERLGRHYCQLLRSLAASPETPVGQLEMLPPEEKRQLLVEWNATAAPLGCECFHQRFEAMAAQTPDAPALVFPGRTMNYGELNARANRLAWKLLGLGVGPESVVAIRLERSPEMIAAVLATLKAGGAWVPLDPDYPAARLAFMLADSGARVLITRDRLPETKVPMLCPDSGEDGPESNPGRPVAPEHLAYVIYTSGSTGQPKGVAVEQRGLNNLTQALIPLYGVTPRSRVAQFASFSFDVSVADIAMTLGAGAALCLPTAAQRMPGRDLWDYCREASITHLHLPPAALATLPREPLPRLECLIAGGEACPPALAYYWSEGRRFFNSYGPTETTVSPVIAEILHNEIDLGAGLPIGRPIPNLRAYVLDQFGQPVPVGVPGELYIGGIGVARGYLNRPELTAGKFVSDPFSGVPGDHLFKTGDRVRYRTDGNLEFLGRLDHQVKIRGFRVEPGEIEAALTAHPAVREAVVNQKLVAYIVPDGAQPPPAELRGFLKTTLPDYMLPAAWVFLPRFPLGPNGKVDRQALPAPEAQAEYEQGRQPRNTLERDLAGLWEDLLHTPAPGIDADFFEGGGHSLLAVRLAAEVERRLDRQLPVSVIFERPTIARLADWLQQSNRPSSCLVRMRPQGTLPPLFFVPGIGGMAGYLRPLAEHLDPEMPFFAFQASLPHTRMEEVAEHYVNLMAEVQPRGPYFLAGHSLGGRIAVAMARALLARRQEVTLLAIVDSPAPGTLAPARGIGEPEIYRAQLRMDREYRPEALGDVPLVLFRARDRAAGQPQLTELGEDLGWSRFAGRPVPVRYVPGDHESMMRPPHVAELAAALMSHLAEGVAHP